METRDLDQFILTTAGNNWRKVPMVIAVALVEPDLVLPEADDDADFIAGRIEALIDQGALEIHGNPSNWRFSEVRRLRLQLAPPNNSFKPNPLAGRLNSGVGRQERSVTDIQNEVARMASCAVDALHGHPAGALDFSRKSLEVIEAALAEAAPYHSEIPKEQSRTSVQQFGCYVLEVARREFGGRYLWHNELQQPALVAGEPQVHVAMVAWSKVQGRLAGDEADNISFFYSGFAERVTNAQISTHVLYM